MTVLQGKETERFIKLNPQDKINAEMEKRINLNKEIPETPLSKIKERMPKVRAIPTVF